MKVPTPFPRHALEPAPDAQGFRFSSGALARDLVELAHALRAVPVGTAWYHREHLVPWVASIVGDEPLARRLDAYARAGGDPEVYRDTVADLVETRVDALRRAQRAATPGVPAA